MMLLSRILKPVMHRTAYELCICLLSFFSNLKHFILQGKISKVERVDAHMNQNLQVAAGNGSDHHNKTGFIHDHFFYPIIEGQSTLIFSLFPV